MEQKVLDLNDKIYSNNNNILLELIKDLNQVINNSTNNENIKLLNNGINKINYIINENKKNDELLRKNISSISDKLVINNLNKQEIQNKDGKYIGQAVNGLAEGK